MHLWPSKTRQSQYRHILEKDEVPNPFDGRVQYWLKHDKRNKCDGVRLRH